MRVKHVCKPAKIDPLLQVLTADLDLAAGSAGTVRAPLPSVQRPQAGGQEGAALSMRPLPAPLDLGFLRAWSQPPHWTRVPQAISPATGTPILSSGALPAVAVRPSCASALQLCGTSAPLRLGVSLVPWTWAQH